MTSSDGIKASFDSTDARLLIELCKNSRTTGVELASRLDISRNTVQARLNRWDAARKLAPLDRRIPPAALGYPLQAFATVRLDQHQLPSVTQHLRDIAEVIEVFGLSGKADLLVRVVAVDTEDLYRITGLILAITGVKRTSMSIAMQELIAYRTSPLLERAI